MPVPPPGHPTQALVPEYLRLALAAPRPQPGPPCAALLPSLIDKLTPHGTTPAQGLGDEQDLMGSLSSLLQKR